MPAAKSPISPFKAKKGKIDPYSEAGVDNAISDIKDATVGILTKAAHDLYIAASFEVLAVALKARQIPQEIYEIGKASSFLRKLDVTTGSLKVSPEIIDALTSVYAEEAIPYANSYAAELVSGGRNIRIPILGDFDKELGYRPYLGYDTKWVPWMEDYTDKSRRDVIDIIQKGDKMGVWPSRWEGRNPYRDPDDLRWEWQGYEKGSLGDELEKYFANRRSHASTVSRTEVQHLRGRARNERWDRMGYQKFKWVCAHGAGSQNSPCLGICSQFCGKVYYKADLPMGGDRLHPNCVMPDTPVYSTSGFIGAVRAHYTGPMITIHLRDESLTVTPNHMFPTLNGFISADLLVEGDNIFRCPSLDRESPIYPDADHSVTTAKDMFNSMFVSSSMASCTMPVSSEYLHGDAAFVDEEIDVVLADPLLQNHSGGIREYHFKKDFFRSGSERGISFLRGSPLDEFLYVTALACDGGNSGSRKPSAFFGGRARHTVDSGFFPSPGGYPVVHQDLPNSRASHPCISRDLLDRYSGLVELDNVCDIEVSAYSGHVYDFQTITSLYISGSIINSNCKCNVVAVIDLEGEDTPVSSPYPDVSEGDLKSLRNDAASDPRYLWGIYLEE